MLTYVVYYFIFHLRVCSVRSSDRYRYMTKLRAKSMNACVNIADLTTYLSGKKYYTSIAAGLAGSGAHS